MVCAGQGGKLKRAVRVLPTSAAFGVDLSMRGFAFKLVGLSDQREYMLVADLEASRKIWIQTFQMFSR